MFRDLVPFPFTTSGSVRRTALALSSIGLLTVTTLASAQTSARRDGSSAGSMKPQGVVQVLAEDMASGESLGAFERGGTLVVAPGQRVRLRMQTKDNARARTAHYPSTRFEPGDSHAIDVERVNDEVGAMIFTARAARSYRATIQYEILEDWPIPDREKAGRIYIEVHEEGTQDGGPQPDVDTQQRRGATLFADPGFRGASVRVYDNGLNLSSLSMDDMVSSVRIDEGCYVVLYELPGLRGASQVIRNDVGELNGAVGNDRASSIRVVCQEPGTSTPGVPPSDGPNSDAGPGAQQVRGIVLYRDRDFRGESMVLADGDYPTLRGTRIDNGTASSAAVGRGCIAFLYEGTDFRGNAYELREHTSDLRRTPVGEDRVSSARVICR